MLSFVNWIFQKKKNKERSARNGQQQAIALVFCAAPLIIFSPLGARCRKGKRDEKRKICQIQTVCDIRLCATHMNRRKPFSFLSDYLHFRVFERGIYLFEIAHTPLQLKWLRQTHRGKEIWILRKTAETTTAISHLKSIRNLIRM